MSLFALNQLGDIVGMDWVSGFVERELILQSPCKNGEAQDQHRDPEYPQASSLLRWRYRDRLRSHASFTHDVRILDGFSCCLPGKSGLPALAPESERNSGPTQKMFSIARNK